MKRAEPGEYQLGVQVVRLGDDGREVGPVALDLAYTLRLGEGTWFAARGLKLPRVPLSGSGVHEVRLSHGSTVLARDQFLVEE